MSLLRSGAGLPAIVAVGALTSALCLMPQPAWPAAGQAHAEAGGSTGPRFARADEGRVRDKARDRRRDEPRSGPRRDERDDQLGKARDDGRRPERKKGNDDARQPPRVQGRGTEARKDNGDEYRGERDRRPREDSRESRDGNGSPVRISPDRAAAIARNAVGGRVLKVELSGGRYRVKLLVGGERVRTVEVDARTGQLR